MRKLSELYNQILNENLYHGSRRSEISWADRNELVGYNMLGYGIYLTNNKSEAIGYINNTKSDDKYIHIFKSINANIINWEGKIPKHIVVKVKNNINLYPVKGDFEFDKLEVEIKGGSMDWDYLEEPLPQWAIEENGKSGYFLGKYDHNGNQIGNTIYGLTKDGVINIVKKEGTLGGIDIDSTDFYGLGVINELNNENIFSSFAHIYAYLYKVFNSTRKTTEFFVNLGIDGVTFDDVTSDFEDDVGDGKTTVIYNPTKFKSIKTIKL